MSANILLLPAAAADAVVFVVVAAMNASWQSAFGMSCHKQLDGHIKHIFCFTKNERSNNCTQLSRNVFAFDACVALA